jgi:hypothetical protein
MRCGRVRIGGCRWVVDCGSNGIRPLSSGGGRRSVCGGIELGVFSVWGDGDEGVFAAGHGEVVRVAGAAGAWGRWAVAVAGLGGSVAVADAAGVVVDVLLMGVERALGGDFFEVLYPLVCEVEVLWMSGILWYWIAVADRRRGDAVGGVGAAAGGGGAAGAGRDDGAVSVGRAGAGI